MKAVTRRFLVLFFALLLAIGLSGVSFVLWPGEVRALTYTVTSTGDSSPTVAGELRFELNAALAALGTHTINFNSGAPGAYTISLNVANGALPNIIRQIDFNGAAGAGEFWEIDGSALGAGDGLYFAGSSSNSQVTQLAIYGFPGHGVVIDGQSGITLDGNFIGTDFASGTNLGNTGDGVHLTNGANDNTIGGDNTGGEANTICRNSNGVVVENSGGSGTPNNVYGNYIGTDSTSTTGLGNTNDGVYILNGATYNNIGGAGTGQDNAICSNASHGVQIDGATTTNNTVKTNYIGTDAAGATNLGNTGDGVHLTNSASTNTIGGDSTAGEGNVISGNTSSGVCIDNSTGQNVKGNYIGTNAAGDAALANGTGVYLTNNANTNTIGGTTAGERNIISGNTSSGVYINGSTGNNVQGNYIGTNAVGDATLANVQHGVYLEIANINTIGGATAGEGNAISGNTQSGIFISNSTGNNVQGNYIGTDASGTAALANSSHGVHLVNSANTNTIGGTTAGHRNVISGNTQDGVRIDNSTGNTISANYIGTDETGSAALPNGTDGVFIGNNSDDTTVGGTANASNTISNNGQDGVGIQTSLDCEVSYNDIKSNARTGVVVWNNTAYRDKISLNSIYGNGALGVDLGGDGVTPNDGNNNNTNKPNRGYNFPVFSSAYYVGGIVTATGTAPPNSSVEIYYTGPTPDGSGHGQGLVYLTTATANGSGNFSASLAGLSIGDRVSATASSPAGSPCGQGNTSEFSGNAQVDNPPPTVTSITPNSADNDGTVNITNLKGTNFRNGAAVKLRKSGQADINATNVNVVSSQQITCKFNLNGATTGKWDVVVINDDTKQDVLSNGFTIEYPAPTVESISPSKGSNSDPVEITNLAGKNFRNGAAVKLKKNGQEDINATNVNVVSSQKITCDFNLKGQTPGSYNVEVKNTDNKSGMKENGFQIYASTWYLAEGTTAWGFDTYITIENPNYEPVTARVTYMTDSGTEPNRDITVPARSKYTLSPRDDLGDKDFSTKVDCLEGKMIAVDRTMLWRGQGTPSPGGHCSIGVTSPAETWYLPEGSSSWGFECWLLIQNPNDSEATAHVTYMIEGADPQAFEKKIPANSRSSYNMADDIGNKDASIKVTSDLPVIPERSMYRNNRREGHDSIGTTSPAPSYYLAEGTTDYGFTTYVLVQNPNSTPTDVTVTYMTSSGAVPQAPFNMPANSRKTIRVNDVLPASDFSTQITGSQPIIAERAMYWGENTELGEACHDSIGVASPHRIFYLPFGQTSAGWETYTLVMNPNDTEVEVEITYLTPEDTENVAFTEAVAGNSRITYNMADKWPDSSAAIVVECKTTGKMIMVERAMYYFSRGAGTCTIGGYSD
ncbi:MAG: hypothetical protein KKB90_01075 [Actinobacteria bacterium]|nr:hypothetical protein [Actinomycetota bacterium]MCG2818806.1 hypothetical protein [Actinomycetes bacterium]MBU4217540.1 hypothetical protein [Actinomycetota bacterium]MBU4358544.1 hypothetical protein [Actinomycetota bacterium]MBU4391400.1 hypothetical protein [Actinomycetota bacterium]